MVVIGGGQFALDALDLQGKPDPAFADASWPEFDDTLLNSMVRLDNGKLLLAGIEATYQSEDDDDEEPVRAILVVRLLADGTPDRSYGVDGVARLTYNVKDYLFPGEELGFAAGQLGNVRGLALLDDGGVLIYAQSVGLPSHPLLLRLSPDGEWDRSFGQNGVVAFSLDYALLLDPLVPGSRLVVDKNIAWFADDFWFRGGEYWTTDELTALLVRVELDRL